MNSKNYKFRASLVVMLIVLINSSLWAQAPDKMSYQAVIRDADDELITDTQVGMQITILQGSEDGTVVYIETQSPSTNANGLISIQIGGETGFSDIDWSNGSYFIKTETDPTGGTNYNIIGTTQLLSVPYALHAKTADGNNPGNVPGDMQYWNGSEWAIVEAGNEGDVLTFVNNTPTWVGQPTEENTVINPTTGKTWMDRNLGASQVATSSSDEEAYGDLYQWGRGTDGHEKRTAGSTTTLSSTDTPDHSDFIMNPDSPFDWRVPQNDNLWQGVNGVNNPCPSGYRLPTESEWAVERGSWSSNNAAGAFNSPLKLPAAGQRKFSDASFVGVGTTGYYWSSTLSNEAGGIYSRFLNFFGSNAYEISSHRASADSVRCIKE